jgi:hypothetical protein
MSTVDLPLLTPELLEQMMNENPSQVFAKGGAVKS